MITLLSPAKKLSNECRAIDYTYSQCSFLDQSQQLVKILKNFEPMDLQKLMGISENLSLLNWERFKSWRLPFDPETSRQAAFTFMGDTYVGLDSHCLSDVELKFSQSFSVYTSNIFPRPFQRL